jgi:hypothetical protein
MTADAVPISAPSFVGRVLACLPAVATILIYFKLLPALRANFPNLTPYERHLVMQWDHTVIPQFVFFVLTMWAVIYQNRIQRSWLEIFCWLINIFLGLFMALCLLLVVLRIDPMPRQL